MPKVSPTCESRVACGCAPNFCTRQAIPLSARILAVADTLDAVMSERPYRAARSWEAGRDEIERASGTQFDPDVVAALQACERELRDTARIRRHVAPGDTRPAPGRPSSNRGAHLVTSGTKESDREGWARMRAWGSMVLCALFVAAIVAILAAPASAASTLRVDLPTDLDYTDPALSYLSLGWQLEYSTCAKLMNYPDSGPRSDVPQPEIAAAPPLVSPDGHTYTFTIRSGLRFSNGAPVTAADVAWTFNRTLSPMMQSPARAFVSDLVGVAAYETGAATSISGITIFSGHPVFRLSLSHRSR